MSLLAWLTLSLADGLGPTLSARLVERAGSVEAAATASQALLRTIEGVGTHKALKIGESLASAADEAKRELDRAAKIGVEILTRDDDRYPHLLAAVPSPPIVLYLRGTLEPRDLNAVAIVGSRKCSVYGREQAERFGGGLAGVGLTVVSGGARGIDTHAHKGAMVPRNGRTIAVLGCGVDHAYPPENAELFHRIASDGRGAILSEFPIGTPPVAENFPRRNRIVSGMSRGVLVIEADVRSGALITVRIAVDDHERPVFAIPGRVDNPLSAGPHKLIREGALLVETIGDVVENLGPLPEFVRAAPPIEKPATLFEPVEPTRPRPADGLTDRQQAILAVLDGQPIDVDTIADRTALLAHVVLQELTMLTIRAAVTRHDGQRFTRKR